MSGYRKVNGEMRPVTTEGHPQYYFKTQAQAEAALSQLPEGADVFVEEGSNEDLLPRVEQAEENIVQISDNLSVQDLTSQLQYRYCRPADARERLLRIGNLMIYHICLITTSQVTNNTMDFVKIPSNLLPSANAMTVGWTNNNEANYAKYNLPFTVWPNNEYNLNIDYTSLGGALAQNSWICGTIIWTIGH